MKWFLRLAALSLLMGCGSVEGLPLNDYERFVYQHLQHIFRVTVPCEPTFKHLGRPPAPGAGAQYRAEEGECGVVYFYHYSSYLICHELRHVLAIKGEPRYGWRPFHPVGLFPECDDEDENCVPRYYPEDICPYPQ